MSKFCEMPSGRLVDTEDIIYVGLVKDKMGLFTRGHFFEVTWASRVTYSFCYDNEEACKKDREFLRNILIDSDCEQTGTLLCD